MLHEAPKVNLRPGEQILLGKSIWTVSGQSRKGWLLRSNATNQIQSFTNQHINRAFFKATAKFLGTSEKSAAAVIKTRGAEAIVAALPYSDFDKKHQDLALHHYEYVMVLRNAPKGYKAGENLKALLSAHGTEKEHKKIPDERLVRVWDKKLHLAGDDIRVFIPLRYRTKTKRRKYRDERMAHIYKQALEIFTRGSGSTIAQVVEEVRRLIKAENAVIAYKNEARDALYTVNESDRVRPIKVLSRNTIRSDLEALIDKDDIDQKHGPHTARKIGRHSKGKVYANYPLEVVQCDTTVLDIFVNVPGLKEAVRPYLTLVIDVYSRMILGYYLGFKAPSSMEILKAISMAALQKNWIAKKFGGRIKGVWIAYGKIELLLTDNGVEGSHQVKIGCAEMGTVHQTTRPGQPWDNSIVERVHGKISDFCQTLEGASDPNKIEKDEKKAYKNPGLNLRELEEKIVEYIVDVYQGKPIRKVGIPADLWRKGLDKVGGLRIVKEGDGISQFVGEAFTACVHHYGIEKNGLIYNSDVLGHLRGMKFKPRSDQRQQRIKLKAKTDFEDVSRIYVFDEYNHGYVAIPLADTRNAHLYEGVSVFQHKRITKLARTLAIAQNPNSEGIFEVEHYAAAKESFFGSPATLQTKDRKGRAEFAAHMATAAGHTTGPAPDHEYSPQTQMQDIDDMPEFANDDDPEIIPSEADSATAAKRSAGRNAPRAKCKSEPAVSDDTPAERESDPNLKTTRRAT